MSLRKGMAIAGAEESMQRRLAVWPGIFEESKDSWSRSLVLKYTAEEAGTEARIQPVKDLASHTGFSMT